MRNDQDLNADKPVVLLRGSEMVFLTAVTDPPGGILTWQVLPNQSSGTPPVCDPVQGPETQLSTDRVGSFSVAARLNGAVVFGTLCWLVSKWTPPPQSRRAIPAM